MIVVLSKVFEPAPIFAYKLQPGCVTTPLPEMLPSFRSNSNNSKTNIDILAQKGLQ